MPAPDPPVQSRFADLNGAWLVHALLAGGLDLGLRMRFVMDASVAPAPLHAGLWLATANPDVDAPLLETDTTVAADGTFILRAVPLVLGPDALKANSSVSANVILAVSTLSADAWCGTATGNVEKPLSLDLAGSTFAAVRDDLGTALLENVMQGCYPPRKTGDAPPVARPAPPDLSSVPSQLADLTGNWLLNARLANSLPEKLWASLTFIPATTAAGGGSLDGALRKAIDPPGGPALVTFTTTVTADGRFELWLPNLQIGTTSASLLLVGATQDATTFCGAGAGQVTKPFDLDLAGTTFAAIPFVPGSPVPDSGPDHCP